MEKEEKIAEFVGVMLGDGNIGIYDTKAGIKEKNRIKKQYRVKITLDSRNKQYTNYIINLLKEILETEPRVYYKSKENAVDIATYRKNIYYLVINDIGLEKSPKWGKMRIPDKYSKGKLSLLVLKGLFDTDGHLSIFNNNGIIYPRIEIRLCPSPAQQQINRILDEFEFVYRIQNLERGKTRVRISGMNQLKRWFDLIGSSNSVHMEKAKKLLK